MLFRSLLVRLVDACRRNAPLVVLTALLFAGLCGYYAATHLSIDTDTNKLISEDVPWRKREAAFDHAFPQNTALLAVVIDGATPDQADDAAAALTARLKTRPELFKTVRRPEGGEFFVRNGLLFLPLSEVQQTVDDMIAAQPLIGALAADPSLRGLFDALSLGLEGVKTGDADIAKLQDPLDAIAQSVEAAADGTYRPLSWQNLLTGRDPERRELRRFVLVQPVLDYSALEPGARASEAVRETARDLGLTPDRGVRVRLTGSVALSDEEFATVAQGAGVATLLSVGLVILILFLAVRSLRLIAAILITLFAGLAVTGAFAVVSVGALNMISVAFAVLFVGIAVDFSIQFSVRYRDERFRSGSDDPAEALRRTAATIGGPLTLAAAATAVGFYAFVPTAYSGVSELGVIAGTSMVIALALNLTLLPALLTLLRPPGEEAPVGYARLAALDRFMLDRRRAVMVGALLLAAFGLAMTPMLRFDFDPLNLKDPHTESVSTLFDLMKDPDTTPYTIDILTPSVQASIDLAKRLGQLPEVSQAITVDSYVPNDQDKKLAILSDAQLLLGPTVSPSEVKAAPDDAANMAAIEKCMAALRAVEGKDPSGAAGRLDAALSRVAQRGAAALPLLRDALVSGLPRRLDQLRLSLQPEKVTLETLPEELKRAWVTPDGRSRIEVFPKGDATDHAVLRRFVDAVRNVAPDATGTPVSILESGRTVVGAFREAGIIAVIAIGGLLALVLRRVRDVALVLAPLLLAALLTAATSVLVGLPINFANIITLPLLLGIGVAFDIYFVMNWRAGLGLPLQSATTRAVLFSSLTTVTAFGSLALSSHPGTSEMGKLLTISLAYTLGCTLFVLPALLGEPKPPPR